MESPRRVVLFTAQEPSGDAHAAPVIARLREAYPDIEPVAFGGPRMEAAGARMLGRTADDGVMGVAGISKVFEVRALHNRIVRWARENPISVHVPVDSPSANLPLCARLKPMGARVVNLVAPQLWAWAPWRIGKIRRISDVLLCLLPFEEEWFRSRGVTAKFIGHPVLSAPLDQEAVAAEAAQIAGGAPRILILPGSRSGEVKRNARLLADAFMLVRGGIPSASGLIVASSDANAERIRAELGGAIPYGVQMVVHRIDAGVAWCDLALAVSGTVSLDCARQAKPVIGVYRTSWIEAFIARFILSSPHRLLPNIVAGRRIVPEFVPYFGNAEPIAEAALELLSNGVRMQRTRDDLRRVADSFRGPDPGRIAAEIIARSARGEPLRNAELDEIAGNGP
jgi:lipid-A-disaccharide synthase